MRLPFHHWTESPLFAGRPRNKLDSALIRIGTDSGLVGWGESYCVDGNAMVAIVNNFIAPLAKGKEIDDAGLIPLLQRTLHNLGRSGPVVHAIAGLDIGLWDLRGKAEGVPVYELLGGKVRSKIRVYASLLQYYAKPDAIKTNVTRALDAGYTEIKLHERTAIAVKAARETMGSGMPLMVDTNCAWLPSEAPEAFRSLAEYRPLWIEEPLWPPEDSDAIETLRKSVDIAVALGENASSSYELAKLIDHGIVDYVQPSVIKLGLSAANSLSKRCEDSPVQCAPQVAFFGPGYLASLHLIAAQKNEASLERLYCELAHTPYAKTVPIENGWVHVPDGPGLGADPEIELTDGRFSN